MTTMKVLSLFGLKFFEEDRTLRFRYVVFINQLKPKIFFEKQLSQYEVVPLDKGLTPKVSSKPDMAFINAVTSNLVKYFESLEYKETKNAIIYYINGRSVCMLSKSTLTSIVSKGIEPKYIKRYDYMPEQMLTVLDGMVNQIINYYVAHWSHVLMYYHQFKRVSI
jgi:hypothetical protein